jgi:glutamine amidotransferase
VDFSALTTSTDVVTILSTEPLTSDERWQAFESGESMLLINGEIKGHARKPRSPL